MLKNWMRLGALAVALVCALSGCARPSEAKVEEAQVDHKVIMTSFFPLYALTLPLMSDVPNMDLRCLVQPQDGCLRSYQLSDWDFVRLSGADAIILGSRGLESFETTLVNLGENGPARVGVMDAMTLIGQDQASAQNDELESHLDGQNPWLFLSVDGASRMSEAIAAAMIALDPGFQDVYARNLGAQQDKLEALQAQMQQLMVDADPQPVALLHEGLPYLAEDLGLNVVCQVDREPGSDLIGADLNEALAKLAGSGAKVVLLEKQAPDQLKAALRKAGYSLALIDTLSTYPMDVGADDYAQVMLANARAVFDAFAGV